MKIEEEKKFVADKLGWRVVEKSWQDRDNDTEYWLVLEKNDLDSMHLEKWNPQDNDKATFKEWDEIYGKMDIKMRVQYFTNLGLSEENWEIQTWAIHITPPSRRWRALIKTLEVRCQEA